VAKDRAFLEMYRERIAHVPLFSGLSDKELRTLAQRSEQISLAADTTLVSEGEAGNQFFVLLTGGATVVKQGKTVHRLAPGDSFGELALITGTPRTATVTTTEPSEVMMLLRRDFVVLLDDFPQMTRKMLTALANWVSEQDT
jgi:CRP-like cAMP-binding protein